jgi:hypothetical protein
MCIENKQAYLDAVAGAEHVIDFALGTALSASADKRQQEKLIVSNVLPYVKVLESAVEQGHFLSRIAQKSKIREDDLRAELRRLPMPIVGSSPDKDVTNQSPLRPIREQIVVRQLFGIMFLLEQQTKGKGVTSDTVTNVTITPDFIKQEIVRIEGQDGAKILAERFKSQKEELLFESERAYSASDFIESDIKELLKRLEIEQLERQYAETTDALAIAEHEHDEGKTVELLEKCKQISKKLSILK